MTKIRSSFIFRFLLAFAIIYGACLAAMGLAVPGGYYSAFIDHYLDFISWLRQSLMWGTARIVSLWGVETFSSSETVLRKVNGRGIQLVYSCLGYGVMSFWIAYIFASGGKLKTVLLWIFGGLLAIWIINVSRLAAVLMSVNSNFRLPLFDHHTWFNILAYGFIFTMMYVHSKEKGVSSKG